MINKFMVLLGHYHEQGAILLSL